MSVQKSALITGITGQDAYFLSKLLLEKEYRVYGLIRGQDNPKRYIVERDLPEVELIEGDLTDTASLQRAFNISKPEEVYNLGAITHVGVSFNQPELTANVTGLGCLRLLDIIKNQSRDTKFYQASTSELFGKVREIPQTEKTPFYPRSPYGSAKAFAHYSAVNYRESYGLHTSCGILFNHESHRRGPEFVTRKITKAAARIKAGLQNELLLGNIYTKRDWGHAQDYVEAMWLMLKQYKSDDYVIATGIQHSVKDVLNLAFGMLDLDWQDYVKEDSTFKRPAEVHTLIGDPVKAKKYLDWTPKISFEEMITEMVHYDYYLIETRDHGHLQYH